MKKMSWTGVQASNGGSSKLPNGGYVLMVTGVKDVPDKEYIELTWDIADGPYKGHYSDEWGRKNEWAHTFKLSYKDTAIGLFKRFLDCLEASNGNFSTAVWEQTSNENAFIGKLFGAAWGTEHYVKDGEKKERKTFPNYYSTTEILEGSYKVPEDKYTDEWYDLDEDDSPKPTENQNGYDPDYVPFK